MHIADESGFVFHASSFALGGQITRPFNDVLDVQAPVTLPSSGGYGSSRAEKFRYREMISFDRAYSQVAGSSRGGVHETLVTSVIEGLNILDMVTADRVVGRLTGEYGPGDKHDPMSLLPTGSYFVNLRIAGVPVSPRANETIMQKSLPQIFDRDLDLRADTRLEVKGPGRARRVNDFCWTTSIFHPVDGPFKTDGSGIIDIEGFGRIILGQYIVTRDSRRLSMIICQLGSPVEGTITAVEPGGNGSPP
jgi:hypothetical protein